MNTICDHATDDMKHRMSAAKNNVVQCLLFGRISQR